MIASFLNISNSAHKPELCKNKNPYKTFTTKLGNKIKKALIIHIIVINRWKTYRS